MSTIYELRVRGLELFGSPQAMIQAASTRPRPHPQITDPEFGIKTFPWGDRGRLAVMFPFDDEDRAAYLRWLEGFSSWKAIADWVRDCHTALGKDARKIQQGLAGDPS